MKRWVYVMVTLVAMGGRAGADDDFRVIKPAEGRPTVAPMKPDWCAGHKGEDKSGCNEHCQDRTWVSEIKRWNGIADESDVITWAGLACDFPNNAKVQQQVAYVRQSWINRTGLSEAEDREALKLYATLEAKDLDDARKEACKPLTFTAEQGSFERQKQLVLYAALCKADALYREGVKDAAGIDDLVWMERPDKPAPQVTRAYVLFQMLPEYARDRSDYSQVRRMAANKLPLANVVAAQLDRKAFDEELKGLGLTGLLKLRARALFGGAQVLYGIWTGAAGADIKDDAKLTQAVADAKSAFAGWSKLYQDNKAAFDAAFSVEDKVMAVPFAQRSTAHPIGCEDLRGALKQHLTAAKPKTKDDVIAAATNPVGYPLFSRLVLCDAAEGNWADAAAERALLQKGRYAAGPHTAAFWAWVDATKTNTGGRLTDEIRSTYDGILSDRVRGVSTLNEVYDGTGGVSEEDFKRQGRMIEQGKVLLVKKSAGGLTVTFKAEKWQEPDYDCKNSGRILGWDLQGKPQYDWKCTVKGWHTETFQLEPRLFSERSGAVLKAGQIVKVVTSIIGDGKAPRPSFVVEVDAPGVGKKGPTPVEYFGIKLAK